MVVWFIFLSLLLHALAFKLIPIAWFWEDPVRSKALAVELIQDTVSKLHSAVELDEPESVEPPKAPRVLDSKNVRVDQEQVARRKVLNPGGGAPEPRRQARPTKESFGIADLLKQDLRDGSGVDGLGGEQGDRAWAPDVLTHGGRTRLNAAAFDLRFVSFYRRVDSRITSVLDRHVVPPLKRIFEREGASMSRRFQFAFDMVLDSQGALVDLKLVRSSGYPELDRAVLALFREAAPFPNPPAQLRWPDGKVRFLNQDFTLYL